MFFKTIDLTTALRPSLLPDEILLFVQDAVGLYEGKYKIPNFQCGHAYLTSHRICYVDDDEPRKHSTAIDLKDVDRTEFQAGFLRSSPKIAIYPKAQKRGALHLTTSTATDVNRQADDASAPLRDQSADGFASRPPNTTWVCPICSFSNPVPSNFDPSVANTSTPIPPCLTCGIKPPFTVVLKAAIVSATNRSANRSSLSLTRPAGLTLRPKGSEAPLEPSPLSLAPSFSFVKSNHLCPRCTFDNHPSLLQCEICGASLKSLDNPNHIIPPARLDSPAPFLIAGKLDNRENIELVKLSFRGGGEKVFQDRLKGALVQRKWILQNAPPVPKAPSPVPQGSISSNSGHNSGRSTPRLGGVGIAGLERRGFETRKNNETVIGNAFEDLEALMASAKDIVALAESFAKESGMASNGASAEENSVLSQSATALGMVTTKDMLGSGSAYGNLYLSELSRNLAEYLTDDRKGILHREGGIMSLIDLWAVFNRSRNGVELVSPTDFQAATDLWEKLRLPVRLRRFKSGLLVVQKSDWSDDKTIRQFNAWFDHLQSKTPPDDIPWDWNKYGKGVTAQEAAQHFGWSVGVATEELEMAEDRGVLCREVGIEGLRFWRNFLVSDA
ncbi:hypothetical protein FQN57_006543 [Myotisia sp. PD_48]|nr:hypothetical protein FQN57_006543 [Myotisia sp. PD_48]